MNWNDSVKKIIAILPQIESIQKAIKDINDKSYTYDDSVIKKEIKEISSKIPSPYDDGAIKKQIKEIKSSIPESFDDSAIKKEIQLLRKEIPLPYDDKKLLSELELIKKSIPSQYNDTEINKSIASLHESIKVINDSILELKRNESTARTYQEIAQNFERELSSVKLSIGELKSYDDTDLVKRVAAIEDTKPPTQESFDDSAIKKEIKSLRKEIPSPYDDSELTKSIKQLYTEIKKQNESIGALSKRCDKINHDLTSFKKAFEG